MYCSKCGRELKPNLKFCTHCGVSVEEIQQKAIVSETPEISESIKLSQPSQIPVVQPAKSNRAKLPASVFILAGVFAATIVVLLGAFFYGRHYYSKDMVVKRFQTALNSGDSKAIAKCLTPGDEKMNLSEVDIKPFIKYLEEKPSYKAELASSLEKQSRSLDLKLVDKAVINENAINDFILVKKGKKLLIFDNYVIEPKPYYVKLNIRYKDTKVTLGENTQINADADNCVKEAGPFLIGIYSLKADYTGKYAKLQNTMEVRLTGGSISKASSLVEVAVNFDLARFLSFGSNLEDAELYIDDKATGIKIRDAKDIGPVSATSKLYAVKDVNGDKLKSSEVQVANRSYVYLEFKDTKGTSGGNNPSTGGSTSPVFTQASASSTLIEEGYDHESRNVLDNNKNTAWVEGSQDDGIGSWIRLESDTLQNVSGLKIINGYAKSSQLYNENNRAAKVNVEFSDGSMIFDLQDSNMGYQTIDFHRTVSTKYIKVTILSVYKGSNYRDTCISDISVY